MQEFDFIARLLAPLSGTGSFGLKDDAAVLSIPAGQELVITKDAIVEDVHFIGNESPDLIARKLLRVNLSDLAAMGADPYGYFLALMLPQAEEKWLKAFVQGLRKDQKEFGLSLLGGDTTKTTGPLALSCTMLGLVPKGKALTRKGARVGDDVWVSGTIGDAALGLRVASGEWRANKDTHHSSLITRYRLPPPRIALGQKLCGIATACIDVSDGLAQDLGHICECSDVGAKVQWENVPLSKAARALLKPPHPLGRLPSLPSPRGGEGQGEGGTMLETILTGGDDYELCFTAPRAKAKAVVAVAKAACVKVTCIGKAVKGKEVKVLDAEGRVLRLKYTGYHHFSAMI